MARTKKPSSRKRRKTVLPALGAGMSLAMVGGASATTTAPTTDVSSQKTNPVITLHEEELSDVSLGTFYVFDRENDPTLGQGMQLAARGAAGGGGDEAAAAAEHEAAAAAEHEAAAAAEHEAAAAAEHEAAAAVEHEAAGAAVEHEAAAAAAEAAAAEASEPAEWAAQWPARAAAAQDLAGFGLRRVGFTPADNEGLQRSLVCLRSLTTTLTHAGRYGRVWIRPGLTTFLSGRWMRDQVHGTAARL